MLQEGAGEEAAPRTWVTLEKGGPSPALCRGGVHRSRDPPPLCPVLISSATSPPGLPCVPPELHACDSLSRVCLGETPRDTEGNSRAPGAPDGLRMDSNVSSVPTSLIGKETLRRAASPAHLPVLGDKPGIWGWGGGSELQAPRHSPAWGEGGEQFCCVSKEAALGPTVVFSNNCFGRNLACRRVSWSRRCAAERLMAGCHRKQQIISTQVPSDPNASGPTVISIKP